MASGDITAQYRRASELNGALFDGIDDYVEIPHHASQLGANLLNGFTISVWVNGKGLGEGSTDFGRIIDKSTLGTTAQEGFSLFYRNGASAYTYCFLINNGTVALSAVNSILPFNYWYHILVTVSSGQLVNFYINGVLSGNANQNVVQTISTITTLNGVIIGNRHNVTTNRTFNGCIKDVKMWNRVLSTDEIALDYAGTNITQGQILNVPLCCDYNDKSTLGLTGTNSGSILTNNMINKIKADNQAATLAAATDKIIALPTGRDQIVKIVKAERAA